MSVLNPYGRWAIAVLLVVAMFATYEHAFAVGRWRHVESPSCCADHCQTNLQNGSDPEDLKIRVSGKQFNKLELFFRDEVRTVGIDTGSNLHCQERIAFAHESDLGAFSVKYGHCDDTVQLFAWKKGGPGGAVTLAPLTPITLKPGTAVVVEWMSTKIAKLRSCSAPEISMIVRFSDANTPWQRFDETTQSWQTLP